MHALAGPDVLRAGPDVEPHPDVAPVAVGVPENVHEAGRPLDRAVGPHGGVALDHHIAPRFESDALSVGVHPESADVARLLGRLGSRWDR
eukprot:3526835-Pyramimonas_sp.AAC.1